MTSVDRRLLVLLAVLAAVGVLISRPRTQETNGPSESIHQRLPTADGWTVVDGVPDEILPSDPRALEAVRRTVVTNGRRVWVSVARYPASNGPESRPSLVLIARARGANSVERARAEVELNGAAGPVAPVNLVSVRHPGRHISVVYWYQLGRQTITDPYELRFKLFLNQLLVRRQDVLLIRLATMGSDWPEGVLEMFYLAFTRAS